MRGKALAVTALWAICAAAAAQGNTQGNKIYKYVDEKGNVVYSQTPPPGGQKAQKLDSKPAYSGRGGDGASRSPYDNPGFYSNDDARWRYEDAMRKQQEAQEQAQQKRQADLEARCNRNRGTDCNDPETLRYMESTQVPGGRYHR
jgi:hypothetical protein